MKDFNAFTYMWFLRLKKAKSPFDSNINSVYMFSDNDEYIKYFADRGCGDISQELLNNCKMKTTKKGTIIAMKLLLDYTVSQLGGVPQLNGFQYALKRGEKNERI